MKPLNILVALAITASASLPVYAGRDQAQILTQQQQERALAEKQAQVLGKGGAGAAGPAGSAVAAKEGEPGTQLLLLKQFHPKHAYGY